MMSRPSKLKQLAFAFAAFALSVPVSQAALYTATLAPEAVGAQGSGTAFVDFDTTSHQLHIEATFSGLSGNTTAAHIHCCTAAPLTGNAGVATTTPSFLGFPLGVTAGTFVGDFDTTLTSSFNSSFVTANGGTAAGAEAALAAGMAAGKTYLNIHTTTFGGGEIRGFPHACTRGGDRGIDAGRPGDTRDRRIPAPARRSGRLASRSTAGFLSRKCARELPDSTSRQSEQCGPAVRHTARSAFAGSRSQIR